MVNYLLGIDAGGTKTDFVLSDHSMNIIKQHTLGCANPIDIGIKQAQKIIEQGILHCCKEIPFNEISCFAGLAGGCTGNNKNIMHTFFSKFGFAYFDNGSDIDNCIAMTLGNADGVVVIMGTGVVAFLQQNKTLYRIGGWGYLIDKGGSGFNIGADALLCALGCYDQTGGSALIKHLIEKDLNKNLPDVIPEIYEGGKAKIASFAPIVFEAYKQNDTYAKDILSRNVKEVTTLIKTAFKIAQTDSIPVCICGGLTREKEILQSFFMQELPCCNLNFITDKPVRGALLKAACLEQRSN